VDESQKVCNGATGENGADGEDGHGALVLTTDEPEGSNCTNGGVRISSGIDANDNGVLETDEVTSTTYVCDGNESGPPYVLSTSPSNATTGIAINTSIMATFSEAMFASTITTSTFTLKDSSNTPVSGSVLFSGTTATFTPLNDLAYSTTYTAEITTAVHDLAGNQMTNNFSWIFMTVNASGSVWTQQIGTSGIDAAYGVAVDNDRGNIYIAGSTNGSLDGNANAGDYDIFLVKYDSTGEKQWTRQIGTAESEDGQGVAVDSAGYIYVTGWTSGSLDGNTNAGLGDIFLVKYDSSGTKLWTKQFGTAGSEYGQSIEVDNTGNIYVGGRIYSLPDIHGSIFIKFDSSGTKQWTKELDSSHVYKIVVDSIGRIYATGYFQYGDFDGNTSAGGMDAFVITYDSITTPGI
jgi:hypothetical protein